MPAPLTPFGKRHQYEKPERVYQMAAHKHLTGHGTKFKTGNHVAFYYRQKLQEQMNIVERKKRLASEAQSMANVKAAKSMYDETEPSQQSEEVFSEEADIFSRKANFEKLAKKFQQH